ncbi:MAG: hypothetical protein Q8N47_26375 [Bryobacterales bacterium]|nr:hypothetical protein [Bryobacterales bacterium]
MQDQLQVFEIASETIETKSGTVAVGGLLLQFRLDQRLLLSENLDQERLGVKRGDAPRLQTLWPEVAQIEGHNDRRLAVDRGRCDVAVLFVVRHPGNQPVVTGDPCLTEVNSAIEASIPACELSPE